jgi:hypothetical protein
MVLRAQLSWRLIGRCLTVIVGSLALLSLASHLWRYTVDGGEVHIRTLLLDANYEHSITTYYQGVSLLAASVLLALAAIRSRREHDGMFFGWLVLCLGFLWLSFDELCEMHEMLGQFTEKRLHPHGYFKFAWVIPGMLIAAAVGLSYVRFLYRLPRHTAVAFVIAGSIYIGGAIGMEMIGANYSDHHGQENLPYNLLADAEELGEMTGVAIFLTALAQFIGSRSLAVELTFPADVAVAGQSGTLGAHANPQRHFA